MKKIDLYLFAAMLISAAACTSELNTEVPVAPKMEGQITINATVADQSGTRFAMDYTNGKLYWTPYDVIGIFTGAQGDKGSRFVYDGDDVSATGTFTGTIYPAPVSGEYIYGVHPFLNSGGLEWAEGVHDGKIRLFLNNGYEVSKGLQGEAVVGFEAVPYALPEYGRTFPMVARSKDNNLHFYNVCGGLAITVDTPGLLGVVIKNNDGGPLWGFMDISFDDEGKPVMESLSMPQEFYDMALDADTPLDEIWLTDSYTDNDFFLATGKPYYALLPPTTLTQGITVTFRTASTSATYEVTSPIEIKRSQFSRLTLRDKGLEFTPLEGNIQFSSQGFKSYCVANFDTNGDGEISYQEALAVKTIYIYGTAATEAPSGYDLLFFENLENFICRGTEDEPGPLQSLNNYWFPKLRYLDCTYNNIHNSVDVSMNPDLETLILQRNRIPKLTLGELPHLQTLALSYNDLYSIDLGGCPELKKLYLVSNDRMESLDLSANTKLDFLNCGACAISSLDLSANTMLETVACHQNNMTSLKLSDLPALKTLYCYQNNLQALDVSGCPALDLLSCYYNEITSIDLSANTVLEAAFVSYNPIKTLDVSNNTALLDLYCCRNDLSTIDISQNTSLEYFRCFGNNIQSLDLSHNPDLAEIYVGGNPLTELDVSNNPELAYLDAVYDEYWNDYRPPYNTYNSPLRYLYTADGQVIEHVTSERLDYLIPFATIVGTRSSIEDGHPHQDVFGTYTMHANTDVSYDSDRNMVQGDFDWDVTVSEYDGDVTRAWMEPMCILTSLYAEYFVPSARIYAVVRGDGNGFYIPLPQKIETDAGTVFSVASADMYYYLWREDVSTGGYHFLTDDGYVLFSLQGDGSLLADKPFGLAIDRVTYFMYDEPYYLGMVNHTAVLTKK